MRETVGRVGNAGSNRRAIAIVVFNVHYIPHTLRLPMWYNAKAVLLNRMWNVEYGTRMQTTLSVMK